MSETENPMIRAREVALKFDISSAQLVRLQEQFNRYDKKNSGKIDKEALVQVLEDLKVDDPTKGAQSMIDSLDIDKSGDIELWEFVEQYGKKVGKVHSLFHNKEQQAKKARPSPKEEETQETQA